MLGRTIPVGRSPSYSKPAFSSTRRERKLSASQVAQIRCTRLSASIMVTSAQATSVAKPLLQSRRFSMYPKSADPPDIRRHGADDRVVSSFCYHPRKFFARRPARVATANELNRVFNTSQSAPICEVCDLWIDRVCKHLWSVRQARAPKRETRGRPASWRRKQWQFPLSQRRPWPFCSKRLLQPCAGAARQRPTMRAIESTSNTASTTAVGLSM